MFSNSHFDPALAANEKSQSSRSITLKKPISHPDKSGIRNDMFG